MSELLSSAELTKLSDIEFQRYGVENFGYLSYRNELSRRLAKATGTERFVMYSNIAPAVPEAQRSQLFALPGYERHVLAAMIFSAGFPQGGAAFVSAPPNPVEFNYLKEQKRSLEEKLGPLNFKIFFYLPWDEKLINLYDLDSREYDALCMKYANWASDPKNTGIFSDPWYHSKVIKDNFREFSEGRPTFIFPFITTSVHNELFTDEKQAVLPSVPTVDKASNSLFLKDNGFKSAQNLIAVSPDGRLFSNFDEYKKYCQQADVKDFEANEDNIRRFAEGIIKAVEVFWQQGKRAFIKLDASGVSGLGNVSPASYRDVYDPKIDRKNRVDILKKIIQEKLGDNSLPSAACVEEYIETTGDYGVAGMMVDGNFFPTSIFPFGTDENGIYTHGWISTDAASISEDPEVWKKLFEEAIEMGKIRAEFYKTGIASADFFTLPDGRIVVHDFNDRQGGRTFPEAWSLLNPGGWVENEVKVPIAKDLSATSMYLAYTEVCRQLYNKGHIPFSTAFGYFGIAPDGHRYMKFKVLSPFNSVSEIPKEQHHQIITKFVEGVVSQVVSSF